MDLFLDQLWTIVFLRFCSGPGAQAVRFSLHQHHLTRLFFTHHQFALVRQRNEDARSNIVKKFLNSLTIPRWKSKHKNVHQTRFKRLDAGSRLKLHRIWQRKDMTLTGIHDWANLAHLWFLKKKGKQFVNRTHCGFNEKSDYAKYDFLSKHGTFAVRICASGLSVRQPSVPTWSDENIFFSIPVEESEVG